MYARVCIAPLRREALLDRAGLKLGHGVDEERSGCGNTDAEGKSVYERDGNEREIERERNVGGTQAVAGSENKGLLGGEPRN